MGELNRKKKNTQQEPNMNMAMFLELKPEVVSGLAQKDDRDISRNNKDDRDGDDNSSNCEGPCEGPQDVSRCSAIKDENDSVHYIPKEERIKMLRASGYTDKDISKAIKNVQRVQKGRVQSARIASNKRSMGYSTGSFGIPCRQTRPMVYVAAAKNKNDKRNANNSGKTITTGMMTRSRGQSTFGFSSISKFK